MLRVQFWQRLKTQTWEWRGVWISAPLIAGLIASVRLLGLLQTWELYWFDVFLRRRAPLPTDERIVIVGIDEQDVQEIGQAILPDRYYAQAIKILRDMKPRAIGLDVYRDVPVEPGHLELLEILETTPILIGVQKVIGESQIETVAPAPALKKRGQIGANDLIPDADQKIRRTYLSVKAPGDESLPSFSLYLAALYLKQEGISLSIAPGTNNWWQIGDVVYAPFEETDGAYVRADAGDYQVLLNYRDSNAHFETVPLRAILNQEVPPDWARDRIVLIGYISESFKDVFATPFTTNPSERMPGVEIHAQSASQILSSVLDERPLVHSWPEPAEYLWILFWSSVGSIIAWRKRYSLLNFGRVFQVGLAAASLLVLSYGLFLRSYWIPVVPPMLALFGSVLAITAYVARSAAQIRQTFGRYLSNEIVSTLLESSEGLALGGERRQITILTSDLRGFTALSERLSPEEVVKVLNFYLGAMADVITSFQGTIDEFMGDGILVLFGAPIARVKDADRAIACSIAMQLAMDKVNHQMNIWGHPTLEMGIGINTGEVVVGNIGSEKRTKYGVVGNQVNLTYRIESYTIGGQVLVSETTRQAATSPLKITHEQEVSPKGVQQPISVYGVGGIAGEYQLFLPDSQEIFKPLPEPLPLVYTLLVAKNVGQTQYQAELVQLSEQGGTLNITEPGVSPPPILSNLWLKIQAPSFSPDDLYGKVLRTADKLSFQLRFTSTPPAIKTRLRALYNSLPDPPL
ncbi:MAG: adenylate/guanylate cyclase domain-containing protein [Cyanobacteria bacterium P01_H01_bin.15]